MNSADFSGPGATTATAVAAAAAAAGGVNHSPFSMFAAAAAANNGGGGGGHHPLQEALMARIRPFGLTVSDLYTGLQQAHKYVSFF
jgi:hypothetical protein